MTSTPADFRYGHPPQSKRDTADYVPNLNTLVQLLPSEMRGVTERFDLDREALLRFYDVPRSRLQLSRLKSFYRAWQCRLEEIAYDSLSVGGRIDWHLQNSRIKYLLALIERDEKNNSETADLLPIMEDVAALQETRRQFEPLDATATALTLTDMHNKLTKTTAAFAQAGTANRGVAQRAANRIADLKRVLDDWFKFYDGYSPSFSWWNRTPYASLTTALDNYHRFLRETLVGVKPGEDEPIVGDPIGREGLAVDLEYEMIPYTPNELISIAEQELAWCTNEWRRVAGDMGLGTDWKAALSRTMTDHLAPGDQPSLIASQAYEAVDYITKRDLLTVPALAIDIWRMAMMTAEAQKTNPFFLGGEQIRVSFPTDSMRHDDKMGSLRANNIHLARATVHHELIPGHHLQMFSRERFNPHRKVFDTPFWTEGWALWWEFLLWDLGFPVTPENRAGMLFWRTHRSARIIFSLNFHIGEWSPEKCIDFLVETVGHDRHTATGEVRRSFNGNYPPLYQAAYMIGAIQIRALHAELVTTGRMTLKEFHDSILTGNHMPIEMVRANLCGTLLPRDYQTNWKFYGESP